MRLWEKGAYEGLDVCLMYVSSVVLSLLSSPHPCATERACYF